MTADLIVSSKLTLPTAAMKVFCPPNRRGKNGHIKRLQKAERIQQATARAQETAAATLVVKASETAQKRQELERLRAKARAKAKRALVVAPYVDIDAIEAAIDSDHA